MTEDYEATYDGMWRDIIEPNGVLDMDQLKRELHDYHLVLTEVPKVYTHITGNKLSKTTYPADVVIAVADEHTDTLIEEAVKEAALDWAMVDAATDA